jgi:hypothetical protein
MAGRKLQGRKDIVELHNFASHQILLGWFNEEE